MNQSSVRGFVLRKPKIAAANHPTSSPEADTLVVRHRSSEGPGGLTDGERYEQAFLGADPAPEREYLVMPATPGGPLVHRDPQKRLSLWYTRNDEIRRFGYDNRTQKWMPLKGGAPEEIGILGDGPIYLEEISPLQGPPILAIGDLERTPRPRIEWLWGPVDWDTVSIPAQEGRVSVETGEVRFGQGFDPGLPVYQYRRHFREHSPQVTGLLGYVGQGDLYLSPIPGPNEYPRIRVDARTYITDPLWSPETGKLLNDLATKYPAGEPVYYDGVHSTDAPIQAWPSFDIGTLTPEPEATELTFEVGPLDKEALTIYIKEEARAIPEIKWVHSSSSFSRSLIIPETVVEALEKPSEGKIVLRFSYKFATQYAGKTVSVGNVGDFYLEDGITFRLGMPPTDLDASEGVPAATALYKTQDEETIIGSVAPGAFTPLPQVPLRDMPGVGLEEDVFYILEGPTGNTRQKVLRPDIDVVYDFENNFLRWTERIEGETYQIRGPTASLKLRHELLLDRNYKFELDKGTGGYKEIKPGIDAIIDFEGGQIAFAKARGALLYEGRGFVVAGGALLEAPEPLQIPFETNPSAITDRDRKPLLLIEQAVYIIESQPAPNVLKIRGTFEEQGGVSFQVLEGTGDVVYAQAYQEVDLGIRTLFPELVEPLAPGTSRINLYDGSETYYFETEEGVVLEHIELRPVVLGPLSEELELPSEFDTRPHTLMRGEQPLHYVAPPGSPVGPNEYTVSGSLLIFNEDDISDYGGTLDIIVVPDFSVDPSYIEVKATGHYDVKFPDAIDPKTLHLVHGLRPQAYSFQKDLNTLYFHKPLLRGTSLRVRYYRNDKFEEVTESISFPVKEKVEVQPRVTTKVSFGDGYEVDNTRGAVLLLNGKTTQAQVNMRTRQISFEALKGPRRVQVAYYSKTVPTGHERVVTLEGSPWVPEPVFEEGKRKQAFYGDHRETLRPRTIMVCEADVRYAYEIESEPVYDAETRVTVVTLSRPALRPRPSRVFVSTKPVTERIEIDTSAYVIEPYVEGEYELRVAGGDLTGIIRTSHLLFLGSGDPQVVVHSGYDPQNDMTVIQLSTALREKEEGSGPTLQVSRYPVYMPDPAVLFTSETAFAGSQYQRDLIRFPATSPNRGVLCDTTSYEFSDDGSIVLDPANPRTILPEAGDLWKMSYISRRTVTPISNGVTYIEPRLRASYTRYIAATHENGIAGSTLKARYTVYSPDTFYFRALALETFATEIATETPTGGRGALYSFVEGPSRNHDYGEMTLLGEAGHLRDVDRVGRFYIEQYHAAITGLEAYGQSLDGRVVGDKDGPFRFELQEPGQPGGEDPFTGELIPYYANPERPGQKLTPEEIRTLRGPKQKQAIQNDIDDYVLVAKKIKDGKFEGLYKQAWEPGEFSRFYPETSFVALETAPGLGSDPDTYTYRDDHGEFLGDLGHENILGVQTLTDRGAAARVASLTIKRDGPDNVVIQAGMLYDPVTGGIKNTGTVDLEQGMPAEFIPGFKVGDLVHLGRMNTKTGEPYIYARSMEVVGTSPGEITLTKGVETDPLDLLRGGPLHNDFKVFDTIFVEPETFYREGFDFGVNGGTGQLVNKILPPLIGDPLGQNAPGPGAFLEAFVTYKNNRTEPRRVPALLEGSSLGDDGLLDVPFWGPLTETELQKILGERRAWDAVLTRTTPGTVVQAVLEGPSFELAQPLHTLPALDTYDLVTIEGLTGNQASWTQGSRPYYIAAREDVTTLVLAAFEVIEGNLTYTLRVPVPTGGQVDPNNGSRWLDDSEIDFTTISVIGAKLIIGASTYTITGRGQGYVEVGDGPLPAGYTGSYVLEITGTQGFMPNLFTVEDSGHPTISYEGLPVGPGTELRFDAGNVYNDNGPYAVARLDANQIQVLPRGFVYGDIGRSFVLAISPIQPGASTAYGATQAPQLDRIYLDSNALEESSTVIIRSGTNAGYYYVKGRGTEGGIPYVEVEPPLRVPEGDINIPLFPIHISHGTARRFSEEVKEAYNEVERYKEFLEGTETLLAGLWRTLAGEHRGLAGDGIITTHDGSSYILQSDTFSFGGSDFPSEGIYILIEDGPSRGYFKAEVRSPDEVKLLYEDKESFGEPPVPPVPGSNITFTVYLVPVTSYAPRTFEFVLYEWLNVKAILERLDYALESLRHDPNDFGAPHELATFRGDPTDACIMEHVTGSYTQLPLGNESRRIWITPQNNGKIGALEEIEYILKSSENLYDRRFVWIDFRVNMETGTLPRKRRFEADYEKRRRAWLKEIIKERG